MTEQVRYSQDGPIARIVLDDPERRNAQTPATWQRIAAIGRALPHDVRVVILQATGPSFSAGLDRRMLAEGVDGQPSLAELTRDDATLEAFITEAQSAFTWWRASSAISIAAVRGHAIGAGAQLMLACDLAIVGTDLQFALREIALGLIPDLAGTSPLVRRVGYARALEICATGRSVGAGEAVAIGLAEQSATDPDATAQALAEHLVGMPAQALRAIKPLLSAAEEAQRGDQLAREREAQRPLLRALTEMR